MDNSFDIERYIIEVVKIKSNQGTNCKFEEIYEYLKATRGKKHTLLGMEIEFSDDSTVLIVTIQYIKDILKDFEGKIADKESSPVTKEIFDIDEKSPLLCEKQAGRFHTTCAKLI